MYNLGPFSYSFGKAKKDKSLYSKSPIIFNKNELIAIVGPSGGGKTTFLKILKGIIPEYSSGELIGDIRFNDAPLNGENFQNNLSKILYLFQNPFSQLIYPTPEEEFVFSMENFNFTRDEMNAQKEKFEDLFNLTKIWGKKNSELSNGECQKLVLASLLAINPQVLLLDEPTAFLDPEARAEFYEFLEKIKSDRLVIIVDHHVKEIQKIVSRTIEVNAEGEISEKSQYHGEIQSRESLDLKHVKLPEISKLSLEFSDLRFSYLKNTPIIERVNAKFFGGEIIAIKGKNGVGKSTFFKLIAGIINPTQGDITLFLDNKKISKKKIFSQVGFIFQNPESHFFFDTIEEELSQSFKQVKSQEITDKLLERFFRRIDLKKSPFLLSEGEKRRLSILMTVFLGKSLLLYDEPTFGQDAQSIKEIASLMSELKTMGLLQIYISHDEEFIASNADRVYVLESGSLHEIS